MGLTIREKADTLATFRSVSVTLMETLARWVPSTPELEVKTLFGRHLWDFAQHADALGKRTAELRAALHYTRPPTEAYRRVLETLATEPRTAERLYGLYDALLPDLEERYQRYLAHTDRLLDDPSVRVLERMLADFPRWRADREAVARERTDLALQESNWPRRLADQARAVKDWVDPRPAADAAPQPA
jgi:hypothetical protein